MNEFLLRIENYQAGIAIIIFIAAVVVAVIGFFIKKNFFLVNHKNSTPFINAGGSVSAGGDIIVGDKTVHNTTQINKVSAHNLKTFEEYIKEYSWKKEFIDHKEVWICENDSSYQIEIADKSEEFSEEWTRVYPDSRGSSKRDVYLSINGSRIKSYIFVSVDGGRIFIPLPKKEVDVSNNVHYYWERKSLDFLIGEIIGEFYIYESIGGVARMSRVDIRD